MPINLWELAAQQKDKIAKEKLESDPEGNLDGDTEFTLVTLGSRNCGKSSFILRFLDRDEKPKPTIGLEYTYGRRTRGNQKQLAHIWELGGGTSLLNIVGVPVNPRNFECTIFLIFLDLSKPEELWNTYESAIKAVRIVEEENMKKIDPETKGRIELTAAKRLEGLETTPATLKTPVLFIGGRYDEFQNLDPEKKKLVCKTLRFLANFHGGMLQFFSNNVETLVMKGRVTLSHLLFGTGVNKGVSNDYNKPIFIPFGGETLSDIGPPDGSAGRSISDWKNAFCAVFPQKSEESRIADDPGKDPQFKEEAIDQLIAQKEEELQQFLQAQARAYMNTVED